MNAHVADFDGELRGLLDGLLRNFSCVKLVANFHLAKAHQQHGVTGFPCTVAFTLDGEMLGRSPGFALPTRYAATLAGWLERARR